MSIEYNKIDLEKFKAIKYSRNIILFFDPDGKFHQFLGHKRRTRLFPYHKNLNICHLYLRPLNYNSLNNMLLQ